VESGEWETGEVVVTRDSWWSKPYATRATTKLVEAKKDKTRMENYQTYLKLVEKDTVNFSDAKLNRYEAVLKKLATELAEE
jgi:phage terminase Nu1 subunit (DNA packaging protein)